MEEADGEAVDGLDLVEAVLKPADVLQGHASAFRKQSTAKRVLMALALELSLQHTKKLVNPLHKLLPVLHLY